MVKKGYTCLRRQENLIFFILIIVFVAVVSGCGRKETSQENLTPALSSEEREKTPALSETATSSSEITETATSMAETAISTDEIDISDWKVYKNEEYGYLMKYPKNWTLQKFSDTISILGATFVKDTNKIIINALSSPVEKSDDPFDKYMQNLGYQVSEHPYDSKKEFITTTGIKGYIINWNESMEDYGVGVYYDMAYFEAKKQGFYKDLKTIEICYGSEPTEYSTKIFNAMIKTFDYID